jgi:hypothetical protein
MEAQLASLTIRNLDQDIKKRLRTKAAINGRSMEEEARIALRNYVAKEVKGNVYDVLRKTLEPVLGTELAPLPRGRMRKLPDIFDE